MVTIITTVLNGAEKILYTVNSVLNSHEQNVQYIVIDAGSDDGSYEILKSMDNVIELYRKPGQSYYASINFGLSKSSGELIGILNCGDFYYKSTICDAYNVYKRNPESIIHADRNNLYRYKKVCAIKRVKPLPESIRLGVLPVVNHVTFFVPKVVYAKVGGFSESYAIISDYDWILRAVGKQADFVYVNKVFTAFEMGGMSGKCKIFIEGIKLYREHNLGNKSYMLYKFTKCVAKRIASRITNYNGYIEKKLLTGRE